MVGAAVVEKVVALSVAAEVDVVHSSISSGGSSVVVMV